MITNEQAKQLMWRLDIQDRLILQLCMETGLRISDVLELQASEIKKTMDVLEHKTNKTKRVELSETLYFALQAYIGYYVPPDNRYAFPGRFTQNKRHVSRATIHRHIKRALEGLNFDCSAHSTRKLYAYNILERTGSMEAVQEALNHKYITTTAGYLDIDLTKLIKEAAAHGTGRDTAQSQGN